MAMKFKKSILVGAPAPSIQRIAVNDSQTIVAGSLVVYSSGKLTVAAGGATAGTVAGVALEALTTTTATAADVIEVDVSPFSIYTMPYTGSSKTSLTDADLGTRFDLVTNAYTCNLDDTTGGFLECVGYDNDADTIDVKIVNRKV